MAATYPIRIEGERAGVGGWGLDFADEREARVGADGQLAAAERYAERGDLAGVAHCLHTVRAIAEATGDEALRRRVLELFGRLL